VGVKVRGCVEHAHFSLFRLVGAWRLRSFNPLRGLAIVPLPFLYSILLVVAKRGQEMFVNELYETRDVLFIYYAWCPHCLLF